MSEPQIVACPACSGLNRVPKEKLAGADAHNGAKCGHCKSALFQGHPVGLDGRNFEAHAVKSDLPLLIDFWAPWCGPCKAMAPQFESAAARLEPAVRLAKVNTDDEQALAQRFRIQGIPTIVLLKHGKEVARQSGLMNAAGIESWVARSLGG